METREWNTLFKIINMPKKNKKTTTLTCLRAKINSRGKCASNCTNEIIIYSKPLQRFNA